MSSSTNLLYRMRQGWILARVSLRIVRRRKRIVLLPVVGVLAMATLLGSYLAGTVAIAGEAPAQVVRAGVIFSLLAFASNLLLYFVLVFVNAAVAVFTFTLVDGGTPSVFGSLRTSFRGGVRLFLWAAIAALIGASLRLGQGLEPQLRYGFALAGFLWTFFVPLVAPVVLFEGVGPLQAVRRSTAIRRSTWVEGLGGLASVYGMFFLAGAPGLIPPLLGWLVGGMPGVGVGLVLAALYWVPLFFAGSTTKAVLVAVLYRYSTTGEISSEFLGTALTSGAIRR